MRYFRLHRHRLVWLALIAFAGQFILTFGHVHAYDHELAGAPHEAPVDVGHREIPKDPDDVDRFCAFCRTMTQAQSLVLPSLLPLRFEHPQQDFPPIHEIDAVPKAENASPFASRAPPLTSA